MDLTVPGTPIPQGSLRSFKHSKTGAVVTPQMSKVIEQRERIAYAAQMGAPFQFLDITVPVQMKLHFFFARPKSHYGTGRNSKTVKASAPAWHTQRPDIDKLERLVLDALTGILFADDSQVVKCESSKHWVETNSETRIRIWTAQLPMSP